MHGDWTFQRHTKKLEQALSIAVVICLPWLSAGCFGQVSEGPFGPGASGPGTANPGGPGSPSNPGDPSMPVPATEREASIYRLSVDEYVRTVTQVLGRDADFDLDGIGSERGSHGFLSRPAVALVDARVLEATANVLATSFVRDSNPCSGDPTSECISNAARALAAAAFRRPLATEDQTALDAQINEEFGAGQSASDVLQSVVSRILQGPELQYLVLRGSDPDPATQRRKLLGHELASRLSYALWRAPPDEPLLGAAADGTLPDETVVRAQAMRMLEYPQANHAIGTFVTEWLELYRLEQSVVSAEQYPAFDDALRSSILTEPRVFSAEVVLRGTGRLETLLTADFSHVNEALAALYGAAYAGDGFLRTALPPERRGLLTQSAYLASHSGPEWGDVIHRGVSLNRHVLCQEIPEPPPGIDTNQSATDPLGTPRDRYPQDRIEACRGCHEPINQAGFGFERYDAIGAYHETWPEDGQPIDASGILTMDGNRMPFDGGADAARLLASSDQVHDCFSRYMFRFLLRRREMNPQEIEPLQIQFREDNGDIRSLILNIVASESFTSRAGDHS